MTTGSHHSRVERSVIEEEVNTSFGQQYSLWIPRVTALVVNLILFLIVYYLSGKIGSRSGTKKYKNMNLKINLSKMNSSEKRSQIELLISKFDTLPTNALSKFYYTTVELLKLPFRLRKTGNTGNNFEIREEISKLYIEYGKVSTLVYLSSLRSINYSPNNEQLLLSSLILSKSKLLIWIVLRLRGRELHSHPLGSGDGLEFLKRNISAGIGSHVVETLSSVSPGSNVELNTMTMKYKEELLFRGINQLFNYGRGSETFQTCLTAGKDDKIIQFWAGILWTEAEWIQKGGFRFMFLLDMGVRRGQLRVTSTNVCVFSVLYFNRRPSRDP